MRLRVNLSGDMLEACNKKNTVILLLKINAFIKLTIFSHFMYEKSVQPGLISSNYSILYKLQCSYT